MLRVTWTLDRETGPEGGKLKDASGEQISEILDKLTGTDGSLTIDMVPEGGAEKSLQVLSDGGQFVITLGEETEDDYEVRSFNGPKDNLRMIEIAGNLYRSDSICADPAIVSEIVVTFLEKGDVPTNLLN